MARRYTHWSIFFPIVNDYRVCLLRNYWNCQLTNAMNSGFWKWNVLSWEAVKSPSLKKFKQRMDDQLARRPVENWSRWPLQFLPTLGFCDALFYFYTLLTLSFCPILCSIFIQMKWLSVTAVLCQSSLQSGSTVSCALKHCIYNQYQSICWIWKNSCNINS